MSSRNFRKVCGTSLPAPDSDDSDADYEPMNNRQARKSTYEGLELSTDSDSTRDRAPGEEEELQDNAATNVVQGGARRKRPQKKKGKSKKNKTCAGPSNAGNISGDLAVAGTSSNYGSAGGQRNNARRQDRAQMEELDEIDKSIMEVNALLGAPPPAPEPKTHSKSDENKSILAVQAKFLNVSHELRRLFGPDNAEDIRARNKSQPHRVRLLKRIMIGPTNDTALYDFKKTGLSMSIERREDDLIYFVYDHDQDYQKIHHAFLQRYNKTQSTSHLNVDDARRYMHVEQLLEIADTLFRVDENGMANEIVENVVSYLQFAAHPSFNLANPNVRLLYYVLENRPFHVALLKYMYLLTNKACHRTALEIAKMLLNLDPSDPLAILFIIDTVALRAREHQWLIDALEHLTKQRQANMLLNVQYSYALAHFHMAVKNKKDLIEADRHLQNAILSYPQVVVKILEFANTTNPRIQNHVLFLNEPRTAHDVGLGELILIYAKMTWPRWREPQVMEWFLKNVFEVTENFNNSIDVRERVMELTMRRHALFHSWPIEIVRHVSIIRSMSNLLLETAQNNMNRSSTSWDPLTTPGLDRYSYGGNSDPPRFIAPGGRAMFNSFEPRDERNLLMAHLIATRGRTPHLAAFNPRQRMYELFQLRAMPTFMDVADVESPPRPMSPELIIPPEDEDSNSGDDLSDSPVIGYHIQSVRRHFFQMNQMEAMLNPFPINGYIPNRPFHPQLPVYAINFLNMFHDLLVEGTVNDNEPSTDTNEEESELSSGQI